MAALLAATMLATSVTVPQADVWASAPENVASEVSILSGTPTGSLAEARGTGSSYDGYIQTNLEPEADYLKVEYTVSDESAAESGDCVFNVQPFTSSWGGWQSNFVTIGNSTEEDGVYTCYLSMEDIETSLGSDLYGINISYVENTDCEYQLTGYYACTVEETGEENTETTEAGTEENTETTEEGTEESTEENTESTEIEESTEEETGVSASQQYVLNMGQGWNLGNSFDGVNTALDEKDLGETAWGNPVVTKELIDAVAEKGYDSIRMPMTLYRRYSETDGIYVIDEEWLARYKQVVDWAVEDGLYVMINIHHDSWLWLSSWDGNTESDEYVRFTQLWEQLAAYFAEEPEQVCFETINEPTFSATGSISAQDKLDSVNLAAYHAIRNSGGNNATRMIVMPTLDTNYGNSSALYSLISSLNDENIIVTVHYYSEWVFSANLGKTGFDEVLWDEDYTARKAADNFFETVSGTFTDKGFGVIVGEYGLLGYDAGEECNQPGEELKYYEYMNELAREDGVCLMFWDNGSGIDRNDTEDYSWKKQLVGAMLEASMEGRSSYATGLDTIYFARETTDNVSVPLTLNGNTFVGIEGLTEGTDYTYDEATATVTLLADYVNTAFDAMGVENYGTIADLVFRFSSGADWHEYLVKYATPRIGEAEGTVTDGITIPVDYQGTKVRRATAYEVSGKVGPNSSWWNYLQLDGAYSVDYQNGSITFLNSFFADSTVADGLIKVKLELYDGQFVSLWMTKEGDVITSSPDMAVESSDISVSSILCLYEGETEIPSQYLNIPEGASLYGTWVEDSSVVTMSGWPATMTFSQTACDNFTNGGVVVYYMDEEIYVNVQFGVKAAPVVSEVETQVGSTAQVAVANLAEDAVLSYAVADESIARVGEDGTVTGLKKGSTELTVTVTQYNRTDSFTAAITVDGKDISTAKTTFAVYAKKLLDKKGITLSNFLYCDGKRLKEGKDYKVTISDGTEEVEKITASGTYTVTAEGIGEYQGSVTKTVKATKHEVKIFGFVLSVYWTISVK